MKEGESTNEQVYKSEIMGISVTMRCGRVIIKWLDDKRTMREFDGKRGVNLQLPISSVSC